MKNLGIIERIIERRIKSINRHISEADEDMLDALKLELSQWSSRLEGYKSWAKRIKSRNLSQKQLIERAFNLEEEISKYPFGVRSSQKEVKIGRMWAYKDSIESKEDYERYYFENHIK